MFSPVSVWAQRQINMTETSQARSFLLLPLLRGIFTEDTKAEFYLKYSSSSSAWHPSSVPVHAHPIIKHRAAERPSECT